MVTTGLKSVVRPKPKFKIGDWVALTPTDPEFPPDGFGLRVINSWFSPKENGWRHSIFRRCKYRGLEVEYFTSRIESSLIKA